MLDRILENNTFIEPLPVEELWSPEETPLDESSTLLPNSQDLSADPGPELKTPKEEEIRPLEFPFELEEDLFKDFRNTSNYPHVKSPPIPHVPSEPSDIEWSS